MSKPRYRYNHKNKCWDELYTIDLRTHEIQAREVRDGVAMLFQSRTVIHNLDGSKEFGEWSTSGTCPNYGDIYDLKPSLIERFIGHWRVNG